MRDMTNGSALRHLWCYALPLMLSNWFQMGYNAVDSMIAGRFIGKDALAATGIASPVMNLVILSVAGLCLGAGILMSEMFGAHDFVSLRRQCSTTLVSGLFLSLLATGLGIAFTYPIMKALAVPEELLASTGIYLRITFLGTPFTFLYNAVSAVLKSIGDSKTPLKFLMFSSLLNAVLDIIFIGGLHFGIVCSATTTVIAEVCSSVLVLLYFTRRVPDLCPKKGEWVIDFPMLKNTLRFGGVAALQQSVQPIGKLLIQGQVNALGIDVIAAYNAVTRIDAFALTPEQSIAQAITTYIAQNRGAKKAGRIRHGFLLGMAMEFSYFLLIGTLTLVFRFPLMTLFVTGEDAASVIAIGTGYLLFMSFFYLWPGMTNGVQGFFRGIGRLKITLIGTFLQTSVRVIMTYVLAPPLGIIGIALACVLGWTLMLLVELPLCLRTLRHPDLL